MVNDLDDNPVGHADGEHVAGNHVVIEMGNGRFVMMAHLQQGSVLVAEGDVVRGGQLIAQCGNSGNTSHPHLHLQVQNGPDFFAPDLKTYPILFRDVAGEVFVQAFTPFHPAIQYARRHDFIGFYKQEMEFREQLKYPPASRVASLTLRGRNEEKVKFTAEHVRRELDSLCGESEKGGKGESEKTDAELDLGDALPTRPLSDPPAFPPASFRDLVISGPAPAPLLRAETFYRYQLMLRTRAMSRLSHALAHITAKLALPEDVTLTVDIDPVSLG